MNGEPLNTWTASTLFAHFTALIRAHEKLTCSTREAAELALKVASEANERQISPLNIHIASLEARLIVLEQAKNQQVGQARGLSIGWSILIGLGGLAGVVFGLLKH